MAHIVHLLSLHDDLVRGDRHRASSPGLPTDPTLLHEMADTLDGLGNARMALAIRTQADILAGLGPDCELRRGQA
jgi:hypothetical protein